MIWEEDAQRFEFPPDIDLRTNWSAT